MKKNNKKGFTIVELVIVIAVIAILSAVLIPTFTNITEKAEKSAALQEATNALTVVIAEEDGQLDVEKYTYYFKSAEYLFIIENAKLKETDTITLNDSDIAYTKTAKLLDDKDTTETTDDVYSIALEDLSANVVVYKVANA